MRWVSWIFYANCHIAIPPACSLVLASLTAPWSLNYMHILGHGALPFAVGTRPAKVSFGSSARDSSSCRQGLFSSDIGSSSRWNSFLAGWTVRHWFRNAQKLRLIQKIRVLKYKFRKLQNISRYFLRVPPLNKLLSNDFDLNAGFCREHFFIYYLVLQYEKQKNHDVAFFFGHAFPKPPCPCRV